MATAQSPDSEPTIPSLTMDGPVATLQLNRPTKMNRIEPADLRTLAEHLTTIERDASVRVVILTGTGRVFSAGYHIGDLDDQKSGRKQAPAEDAVSFEAVADALENCRVPTICALNGSVYGGATDLALACDFRLGLADTELVMPAGKLGVHYYFSGMQRYVTRLGLAAAKRLFLSAQAINSDEMVRIGYLDEALDPAQFRPRVSELATTLAGNAPLSLQNMKRALNQIARNDVDMEQFAAGHKACADSADLAEGINAWKARRKPVFKGE